MSTYRTRNQLLLAEPEAVSGTEESPTPGSNAIKVTTDLRWTPNFQTLQTNYVQGTITRSRPVPGGGNVGLRAGCYLKGSGAGGTAPEFGALLRGCGMAVKTLASALTGTAQAGASGSITLAALGPSSTDDLYKGMVIRTTGGTGSGQRRVVKAYNGTTKVATVNVAWSVTPDATTTYSIDAQVVYSPLTDSPETVTLWAYQHHNNPASDSRLRRIKGAMGNWQIGVAPREFVTLNFDFIGQMPANPTDVAKPSAPTYQDVAPERFTSATVYLGTEIVKISRFDLSNGGQIEMFDDPAALEGYDIAQMVDRETAGTIVPSKVLLATRDAFADWRADTAKQIWLEQGSAAGKRWSLWLPEVVHTGFAEEDVRGLAAEGLPFRAFSSDAEAWIAIL